MIKILGVLAAGLVGGYLIGAATADAPPAADSRATPVATYFDESAPVTERLQALEQTVAAERDARLVLEEQIMLLLEEIDRIDANGPAVISGEISELIAEREQAAERQAARSERRTARRSGNARERQLDMLADAGFALNRAEAILDRTSELQWEAMQAQFEARSEGRSYNWADLDANPNWRLRQELGDDDYQRYLAAMGQGTEVTIQNVYESSPAARIGLQAGDQVLAYNGTRVFSTTELRALSAGQPRAGDAVIEIMRNGNRMQLTIPTGPMGVQVNGSRGTISTWRGN
jgi:hypothetical protein